MTIRRSTSIALISFATIISRILGLVREQLFAFLLGATNFADAFFVAFRIPNLLRDLFAEGSLSTAFIPVFTNYLIKKDKKKAILLSNYVINFLVLVIGLLTLLGYLFTPGLVRFIAPGFEADPSKFHLTIIMTRIMMPFLLFISLAAIFMGILNAHNKFFIPALAPALFNVVIILTGVAILLFHPDDVNKAIVWSAGSLLGGIIQFFIHVPYARAVGYSYQFKFDWKFREEGLRQITRIMLPSVIGLAAMQINVVVNTNLASFLKAGSVSYLTYSFRLMQLPIGIFGVAISTVSTALIAKDIARNDRTGLKNNIGFAMKLNSFLSIPSTIFFIILGLPVVQLLFQHGKFNFADSLFTYQSLIWYAPAFFFFSGIKIFAPVFYAVKKVSIPVWGTILSVIVNLILSLLTYKSMGIRGLSLALTVATIVNFLFLYVMFLILYGNLKQGMGKALFKHCAAGLIMGCGGYLFHQVLSAYHWTLSLVLPMLLSGLVYLGFCYLMKVEELAEFIAIMKDKLKPARK
ncbi:MAG: murein biosynthesis integral membrane protein MurJ [bacterium]|nr:murein biosynthesis integral membrane protein MurJ [bacterium]